MHDSNIKTNCSIGSAAYVLTFLFEDSYDASILIALPERATATRRPSPAGDHPNLHPAGDGLPAWSARNRSIKGTDLVLWHTFGSTHLPRPEDWPVTPVGYCGFTLQPIGFFAIPH